MPQINYEIPDELHRQLRIEAAERGTSQKQIIIQGIQNELGIKETKEQ